MSIALISFFLYLRPLRSQSWLLIPGMEPGPPPSSSAVAPGPWLYLFLFLFFSRLGLARYSNPANFSLVRDVATGVRIVEAGIRTRPGCLIEVFLNVGAAANFAVGDKVCLACTDGAMNEAGRWATGASRHGSANYFSGGLSTGFVNRSKIWLRRPISGNLVARIWKWRERQNYLSFPTFGRGAFPEIWKQGFKKQELNSSETSCDKIKR
jgi:hypothetical protein